jgi:PAS domain S-box-containing protein
MAKPMTTSHPNPEEAEYNRKIDRQVIESGKPVLRVVEPRTHPGDRLAWLEVNRVPVFDIDGNIVGILGTYQDITERKEAEGHCARPNRCSRSYSTISRSVYFGKITIRC